MSYTDIIAAADRLKKKYGESDPFALCEQMGIKLNYFPLGTAKDAIKGFFLTDRRIKVITINSDLPYVIRRIITAHELGHAVLHKNAGLHTFHDIGLFDESSMLEKDANLFAAELLLSDDDVFQTLNEDTTFFAAASILNVPVELLDFKFRVMKWKGYKMAEPPVIARSKFLKDVTIPNYDGYDSCE